MGGKEGTDYPETIKKRNGTQVPFDAQKIRDAVRKANEAAQVEAISPMQFHDLIEEIIAAIPRDSIPEVEQVQDIVEEKMCIRDSHYSAECGGRRRLYRRHYL